MFIYRLMMPLRKTNSAICFQNSISIAHPSASISPGNIEYTKHPLRVMPASNSSIKGNKIWIW